MSILEKIQAEAKRRGWNPATLAAEAGIDYAAAWRLLRRDEIRGEASLSAALRALGLSVQSDEDELL